MATTQNEMKTITITLLALFILFECGKSQVTKSLSLFTSSVSSDSLKSDSSNVSEDSLKFLQSISTISVSGLGTSELTTNPSASINAQINLCPVENKRWNFMINFNTGSSQDTTDLKTLSLSRIFYPENSSFGFTGGIGFDIMPWFKKAYSIHNVNFGKDEDYMYYSIVPAFYYLYRKINIKDLDIDTLVSRLETHVFNFEIDFAGHWKIGNNIFNFSVKPYIKKQFVTQGTDSTYQYIFKEKNDGNYLSKSIASKGINVSAQLGKVQLSFIYDYINPKVIKEPNLTGGTFIVKATVIADFLNFNFIQKN